MILSSCGGSGVGGVVEKSISKIMSDELIAMYSLKGMRGKLSFSLLLHIIHQVIIGVLLYKKCY
jgi:hypothetical protein